MLIGYISIALALIISYLVSFLAVPALIRKMKEGKMVGPDVNKWNRPEVPELGGIAAVFSFSISLSVVVGVVKLVGNISEPPILAAISVFFIASMIGLIDDISRISQRIKALIVIFASLPLLLVHYGGETLGFPFGLCLTVPYYLFWLVVVPLGVTGAANAINMSAGYNGLESGQIVVASFFLLLISMLSLPANPVPDDFYSVFIFASLLGCSLALYHYNRFPARIFVGDIGTLGMGAALAAGVIIGNIEFYGVLCILPAFYEGIATIYYNFVNNHDRRKACQNPLISEDGKLSPPKGAERYTLAYLLLSREPMKEGRLVRRILWLYALFGFVALILALVSKMMSVV